MIKELRKEFGNLAGAQSGYHCFKNAVHNTSLAIYAEMSDVSIFSVRTPVGVHAYLERRGSVYSQGLTWLTDHYPELSLNEVCALGGDNVTTELLMQALQISDDVNRYHVVLDNLERLLPGLADSIYRHLGVY
jgi:hypothetical protein